MNLKTRYELYDQDYLDKLSPKELAWLDKFNREYNGDELDRKNLKKNLHNTKRLKKDCGDRNNARNRDILTRAKASNHLADYENIDSEVEHKNYEDYLIDNLDINSAREALEWLAEETNKDEERLESNLINEGKKE